MDINKSVLVESFKNALLEIAGSHIKKIILFGSYARDEETEYSDIDFLILTNYRQNYFLEFYEEKISRVVGDLMLKYNKVFTYIPEHIDTFERLSSFYPLFKNVQKEGVVIYEK